MKRLSQILLLTCFASTAGFAADVEEKTTQDHSLHWTWESDKSLKWDLSYAVGPLSQIAGFGIESPSFLNVENTYIKNNYQIYVDARYYILKNVLTNASTGQIGDSYGDGVGFGLANRSTIKGGNITLTSKVGANLITNVDKHIASKANNWGWHIEIDIEHVFNTGHFDIYAWKWKERLNSVYTMIAFDSNNLKADKLVGTPQFFNTVTVGIGVRLL